MSGLRMPVSAESISSLDEKYVSNSIIFNAMAASVALFLDGVGMRDAAGSLDRDRIRARIDAASWTTPSLRKRLIRAPLGLAAPAWVPVDELDLGYHVRFHPGVVPSGPEATELLTGRTTGPLDRSRPMWRILIIDLHDGDVAMVFTWHHVMGDAMYGAKVMRQLFDQQPTSAPREVTDEQRIALGRAASAPLGTWAHLTRQWWRNSDTLAERWTAYRARPLRRRLRRWGARVLRPSRDFYIRVRRLEDRFPRRVSRMMRFDLARTKALASSLGGSLNDLTVAIAIKAAFDTRPDLEEAGVLVPISLRRRDDVGTARNVVTSVRLAVPAGFELSEIVRSVRGQMRQAIAEPGPVASGSRIGYATMVPPERTVRYFGTARIHSVAGWPASDPRDDVGLLGSGYDQTFTLALTTFSTTPIDLLVASIERSLTSTERSLSPERGSA